MADYDDGRQEYIPAGRGRPAQRPLSAHAHNRPPAPPPQIPKAGSPYGNGRRIQSAAPYRNRPVSANGAMPAPVMAWGDASPHSPRNMGMSMLYGIGSGGSGLFAGMDPGPQYGRGDSRPIASKTAEALDEENRRFRVTLAGLRDENRLLRTERQRMEEELGRARINLVKAEEVLNVREKALSPTIGMSQMYRTPETTALVARLKEQVRGLRAEKDRFKGDLEELLKSTKATRVAELQSEAHALGQELSRQMEMSAVMRARMEDAEALAAAAQRKAEAAEALAREFTDAGATMPAAPARLAPGNTLSAGRVRKTMVVLQQAHRAVMSQAALLRAVFPPGLSMETFAQRAALKAPTAGGTEVLRFLRMHQTKLTTELNGLPGGKLDANGDPLDEQPSSTSAAGGKPPRPRRPHSAGSAVPSGSPPPPPEPSNDPRVLLQGTADLVRSLRAMDMDSFMARPDFEADVEQLADVAALLVAEHKRLTGQLPPVFGEAADEEDDVNAQENPLYEKMPKADPELVPAEEETYDDDFAEDGYEEVGDDEESPKASAKASSKGSRRGGDSVRESVASVRSAPDTPVKASEAPASTLGEAPQEGEEEEAEEEEAEGEEEEEEEEQEDEEAAASSMPAASEKPTDDYDFGNVGGFGEEDENDLSSHKPASEKAASEKAEEEEAAEKEEEAEAEEKEEEAEAEEKEEAGGEEEAEAEAEGGEEAEAEEGGEEDGEVEAAGHDEDEDLGKYGANVDTAADEEEEAEHEAPAAAAKSEAGEEEAPAAEDGGDEAAEAPEPAGGEEEAGGEEAEHEALEAPADDGAFLPADDTEPEAHGAADSTGAGEEASAAGGDDDADASPWGGVEPHESAAADPDAAAANPDEFDFGGKPAADEEEPSTPVAGDGEGRVSSPGAGTGTPQRTPSYAGSVRPSNAGSFTRQQSGTPGTPQRAPSVAGSARMSALGTPVNQSFSGDRAQSPAPSERPWWDQPDGGAEAAVADPDAEPPRASTPGAGTPQRTPSMAGSVRQSGAGTPPPRASTPGADAMADRQPSARMSALGTPINQSFSGEPPQRQPSNAGSVKAGGMSGLGTPINQSFSGEPQRQPSIAGSVKAGGMSALGTPINQSFSGEPPQRQPSTAGSVKASGMSALGTPINQSFSGEPQRQPSIAGSVKAGGMSALGTPINQSFSGEPQRQPSTAGSVKPSGMSALGTPINQSFSADPAPASTNPDDQPLKPPSTSERPWWDEPDAAEAPAPSAPSAAASQRPTPTKPSMSQMSGEIDFGGDADAPAPSAPSATGSQRVTPTKPSAAAMSYQTGMSGEIDFGGDAPAPSAPSATGSQRATPAGTGDDALGTSANNNTTTANNRYANNDDDDF